MQLFTTAFLKHCLLSFWKNIPPHQQPPSLAISSCSSCSAAKDRKASRLVAHTTRKSPWNVTRLWVPSVNSCHICLAACTTFCSNVQSKICRWTTAFLFSCRVCFYSLSLLWSVRPSIHPSMFLAGLPSEYIVLLPTSSDLSHPLFSKITFTELSSLEKSHFGKYNWDKELNFKYGCRPGQEITTWCFTYQN